MSSKGGCERRRSKIGSVSTSPNQNCHPERSEGPAFSANERKQVLRFAQDDSSKRYSVVRLEIRSLFEFAGDPNQEDRTQCGGDDTGDQSAHRLKTHQTDEEA